MCLLYVFEPAPKVAPDVGVRQIVLVENEGTYDIAQVVRVERVTNWRLSATGYEDVERDLFVNKRCGEDANDIALIVSPLALIQAIDDNQTRPSPSRTATGAPVATISEIVLLGL